MEETTLHGPTYRIVSHGMTGMHKLNAVEWLKWAAIKITRASRQEDKRMISNWVIDLFIAAKWAFVIGAWRFNLTGRPIIWISIYLLIANIFTYFWHHLWLPRAPAYAADNPHRERRRFLNLLSAMAFSMATYAFFYSRVFTNSFDWPHDIVAPVAALTFSVGNALTGATGDLHPKTSAAYLLMTSQLVMTFVFVAMLLSTSIPLQKHGKEE